MVTREVDRLFVALALVLFALVLTTASAHPGSSVARAPGPDRTLTLPISINTQSGIPVTDGAGTVFVVGRAESGPYKSSMVVQRMSDGACVICGIPQAYGTPSVQIVNGYAEVSALGSEKNRIYTWRLDEDEGFVPRPSFDHAVFLPGVTR